MSQVTVISGVERRRVWSDEQKRALVAAACEPGASVAQIARRADLRPSQLYRWRRHLAAPATAAFAAVITTDGLRSYRAAMRELGNEAKQEVGRWANNRVENSHLPFRRRERAMLRFRQMKTLQKFASVHANVYNHFNLERHLVDRQTYKERRAAALSAWQTLAS